MDKIKQIMDLPQVKKYFYVSNAVAIRHNNKQEVKCSRPWLSLIKTVFKATKYKIFNKRIPLKDEYGKYSIHTAQYNIIK